MTQMKIEIEGLEEALRDLSPELYRKPLRNFFERSAATVSNGAKSRAPVDTGRLRSSLTYQVGDERAVVGSNVHYAPYIEYGTGRLGDPAVPHKSGHWPPPAALDVWAGRHGFASGYIVARAIGLRGGLEPRKFLRGALEDSMSAIKGFVDKLSEDIAARWGG